MSITITFSSVGENSCTFTDGTNTYTISNIVADQTSSYVAGTNASWTYVGKVQNSSGTILLNNQNCFINFQSNSANAYNIYYINYSSEDLYYSCYEDGYFTICEGNSSDYKNQIYNSQPIEMLNSTSGQTSIPLLYIASGSGYADIVYDGFNNNTITPNSTTSPTSWTFGPANDSAVITGNTSGSTTCTMEFSSSSSTSTNNIQNIGIAGTAAGVYELINQTGSQTLTSGYIASMALLWYSWYGIYSPRG
jgi:hypothetical protein